MAHSSEENSTSMYHLSQPVKSVTKKDFRFPKTIASVNKEGFKQLVELYLLTIYLFLYFDITQTKPIKSCLKCIQLLKPAQEHEEILS